MKKQSATGKTEEHAAMFKAVSDPTRLRIVEILCHQREPEALCVNALAGLLGVTQSAVSQHLRVLEKAGLVRRSRDGRLSRCGLDAAPMRDAAEWVEEYRKFWESQLDALARFFENEEKEKEE